MRIPDATKKSGRRRLYGIVLCILALLILLAVIAVPLYKYIRSKETGASLRVSVSVLRRQNLEILSQVPTITIGENDIDRGYIDVPAATRLSLYNNDPAGCLLHFRGLAPPFEKTLISGLGGEIQIGNADAVVFQEYSKGTVIRVLDYRFYLSEDASPGEYSWPLTITIDETL
jgi:hypothetical protein